MRSLVTALALLAVSAAACGGPEDTPQATSSVTPEATATVPSATATAPPAGQSGVDGYVYIGPQCPVVREDSPCPDAPFQASLQLIGAGRGSVVAAARSDASGYFRMLAPPGEYRLVPERFEPLPVASEVAVVITAGAITRVTVSYDSGIR